MNTGLIYTFLTIVSISNIDAARILAIVPTPSYSHQVAFRPIWKELSLRGHKITLVTTDPMNNPILTNLTEIDLQFSYKYFTTEVAKRIMMDEESNSVIKFMKMFSGFTEIVCKLTAEQLKYPSLQNLIKNEDIHFDVVMVELMHPAMLAFGKKFQCPTIGILSIDAISIIHEAVGNPTNPSLYPDIALPFEGQLSFTERLQSFAHSIIVTILYKVLLYPLLDQIIVDSFGEGYPTSADMMTNVDMLLLNANPIINNIRPVVPSVVYFGGGTHLDEPKALPTEIKEYLDNATEGFIYFSLGSNVKSKDIHESKRKVIIETLSVLPYKILWKYEADDLPGKPENVKIVKWLPQQDVLRHPNIKLFITQGGFQSMEEAIFTHVPLVVMPFMGDQDNNAKKAVYRGYGLSVDHRTMTKQSLKDVILEVIKNDKYRNTIKEIAELALDQPMTGVDRAVWWTEYVLRHKGAKHLRSAAIDMPWYQYLLLDVVGFILLVVSVVSYIIYKTLQFILCYVRSLAKEKVKIN